MKVSTARTAAVCIALCISPLALAQDVTLTIKPKEMQHRTRVHVELLLDAHSNPAPAALQWEFKIPPGLQLAEISPGEAVKKAGKTLVCNGAKCLVYAWNRTTIPNGQIAIATFRTAPSSDRAKGFAQVDSEGRNRRSELQIVDIVAASLDGKVIKIVVRPVRTCRGFEEIRESVAASQLPRALSSWRRERRASLSRYRIRGDLTR